MYRKNDREMAYFIRKDCKPPPVIERPPVLKGPPAIEGPSGVKILEKRPIGVGQFLREKIAIRDIIIEGPGPFIAGGGLLLRN